MSKESAQFDSNEITSMSVYNTMLSIVCAKAKYECKFSYNKIATLSFQYLNRAIRYQQYAERFNRGV